MRGNPRFFCENDKAYKELKAMGLLEAAKQLSDAKYFKGKLAFDDNIYVRSYGAYSRGETPIKLDYLKEWAHFAKDKANIDAIVDYYAPFDGDTSEAHKAALKEYILKY